MRRLWKWLIVLCVVLGLTGCRTVLYGERVSEGELGLSGELVIHGSTSMAKVTQALGEGFCAAYPGVRLQVGGTGSGEAARAVRLGSAQIGNISRQLRESEHPEELEQVELAADGIVLAVHPENPVENLTREEIRGIFSGSITNWTQVGGEDRPITVLGRESASGTRDAFEEVFGLRDCAYEAELTSTGELMTRIRSDRCAVGYLSLDAFPSAVKALSVDGVAASEETILSGAYPVKRPFLQVYRKGSDSRLIAAWFAYARTPEGRQRIREAGVIPAAQEEGQ